MLSIKMIIFTVRSFSFYTKVSYRTTLSQILIKFKKKSANNDWLNFVNAKYKHGGLLKNVKRSETAK